MKKFLNFLLIFAISTALFTACDDDDNGPKIPSVDDVEGVFICNEGGFTGVGASVQYYDFEKKTLTLVPGLTFSSNCQSASVIDDRLFVVDGGSNGEGKVTVLDADNFRPMGVINNLHVPNGVAVVSADRLYVSELYAPFGKIVNRYTYSVLNNITFPKTTTQAPSQSAQRSEARRANVAVVAQRPAQTRASYSPFFYVNDWSGGGTYVYKVSVDTGVVVDSLEVTVNANSMTIDRNNKLWVLSDGRSWMEPPHKNATLARVNLETFAVEKTYTFADLENAPKSLTMNGRGDVLYFLNDGVFTMKISDQTLPETALIPKDGRDLHNIGVNPANSDIFVSDVKGYIGDGVVYHYSATGVLQTELAVGNIPGTFAFYVD